MGGALENLGVRADAHSRYCDHWPRAPLPSAPWPRPSRAAAATGPSQSGPCRRSRIASAWPASPPASSSIKRSSRLTAKVTPAAFTGCRSQGASRWPGRRPDWTPASRARARPAARRARTAPARRGRALQQVGHGRRHGGDVEHPAAAHHHQGPSCGAWRQTRPTSKARSRVGGQVMIGNSGSSHAGSLGPSFVRSWSDPRRDAPGTASESRSGLPNVNMLDFCSTYWTLMPDTADVPAIRRAHDILRTLAAQRAR